MHTFDGLSLTMDIVADSADCAVRGHQMLLECSLN